MFNKPANPRPMTAPQPPLPTVSAHRSQSALGSDLVFEGVVSGEGEFRVDGTIKGEVRVARLVIADGALVEGLIRCGEVEVQGRVVGDIQARAVKLHGTAHVEGDITHEQLAIEIGAYFQGRCQQAKRAAPATAEVIEFDKSAG